jgi:hypothetical protein
VSPTRDRLLELALLGVVAIVGVYWASRVSMGVDADLRDAVFQRVQAFSAHFHIKPLAEFA